MYMLNMVIILIVMYCNAVTAIDKIPTYLLCYVQVECSARLEQAGYNQVVWLAVNGASASGTQ